MIDNKWSQESIKLIFYLLNVQIGPSALIVKFVIYGNKIVNDL